MEASRARVRDATAADAAAIRAIALRAWPAAYRDEFEPEFVERVLSTTYREDALERDVAACAAEPDAHFLVAERDGAVAGYLHYAAGELHRLYVDPGAAGSGIGTALLDALEARLRPGAEIVALVAAGNERALAFYARRGFERAGLVDGMRRFREHHGLGDEGPSGRRDVLLRRRLPA